MLAYLSIVDFFFFLFLLLPQPLSRSLNADVPEQLITPLVSLGHISMLAPDQFASPMKSVVANFIVKDLLMNDRVRFSFFGKFLLFCLPVINSVGNKAFLFNESIKERSING